MVTHLLKRGTAAVAVGVLTVASLAGPGASAPRASSGQKASYTVVLKENGRKSGLEAIQRAGGEVVEVNKLGIARVTSTNSAFASTLRSSGAIDEVGSYGGWQLQPLSVQAPAQVPGPEMAGDCAAQYGVSVSVGPDRLSACQWDMRLINASPTESYAVERGAGATIGILDTGVDYTHPDIAPNIDLGLSCSFITPGNPTADPSEIDPTGSACATKSATQDLFGHGTHVAGIAAAPINEIGVAGVAPEATIVSLKVCTAGGYCFTQEVVDALVYAGDKGLDVANLSLFADPFLFNCRNEADQRAIVKAISRATQYATQRGVVVVASAGNEADDLAHPTTDEVSPDYPPGAAITRDVGNQCLVLPAELPWVATVSAVGPQGVLSFYSNYGNAVVDVAAPGGSSAQAPNPFGRVLNAWGSEAPPLSTTLRRLVEDCANVGGEMVCALYGWLQGTSMAAPHAAGVAALIRAVHPSMPPMAVVARMQSTALPMDCDGRDPLADPSMECKGGGGHTNFYGSGLVDALGAVRR